MKYTKTLNFKKFSPKVFDYCKQKKIEFFSAPYDKASVDYLDKLGVNVFKIGSGDLTWLENIGILQKNKPIILATGAIIDSNFKCNQNN